MSWLGLTMQFKYSSSLPQCEQGNTLKENKKRLKPATLYFTKEHKRAINPVANFTKQNKICISSISVYFGHHLALCKLKEIRMFLITISRFLVVGCFLRNKLNTHVSEHQKTPKWQKTRGLKTKFTPVV